MLAASSSSPAASRGGAVARGSAILVGFHRPVVLEVSKRTGKRVTRHALAEPNFTIGSNSTGSEVAAGAFRPPAADVSAPQRIVPVKAEDRLVELWGDRRHSGAGNQASSLDDDVRVSALKRSGG